MNIVQRIFLALICALAIVAIAGASESFVVITNNPWWVLGGVLVIAFLFRKPAFKTMDSEFDSSPKKKEL